MQIAKRSKKFFKETDMSTEKTESENEKGRPAAAITMICKRYHFYISCDLYDQTFLSTTGV